MMRKLLLSALVCAVAGPVAAQSTGTPVFHAPYRFGDRYEIGGNVADQGNITFEGFYGFSQAGANWDLALRAGIQDEGGPGGRTAVLAGVDARFRVITQNADFPLDGAIISGVGSRLVTDASRLFIPIGISLGRRIQFTNSTASIVPYAEPVIVPNFGDGPDDTAVALGLGGDLRFNRRFEVRVNVGIGDIENFSIGVSIAH
jgi:hypothetical protein